MPENDYIEPENDYFFPFAYENKSRLFSNPLKSVNTYYSAIKSHDLIKIMHFLGQTSSEKIHNWLFDSTYQKYKIVKESYCAECSKNVDTLFIMDTHNNVNSERVYILIKLLGNWYCKDFYTIGDPADD
jgi:hypothetical protein